MSAEHHNYLRTKRELTFKAKGLQLGLWLRRDHLPGEHQSCRTPTAGTQALERTSLLALSTPPRRFGNRQHPQTPGISACSARMNKGYGQGVWNCSPSPSSNPWGPTGWPGSISKWSRCEVQHPFPCANSIRLRRERSWTDQLHGGVKGHQRKLTSNMFEHTNVLSVDQVKYA